MIEMHDLSLNRSLEELIDSYWRASDVAPFYVLESAEFSALENYLQGMDAL